MKTSLLARLSLLGCALFFVAADWPRFQGPNGTGISTEKGVPTEFTDKDHVFKVALPGVGHSSPIVSKGRVFVHASAANGSSRMLLSLDATTGKTIWTKTIPAARAHTHNLNTLASATPAADGERVYVPFWDGTTVVLHAFDFEGNPVWKHSLGTFKSQHGTGTSPVVYDGKVLLLHDQDKDKADKPDRASLLVCLDAKSGTVVWEKVRPAFRACYSSPFVVEQAGEKETRKDLVLVTTAGVAAYDLADGKERWSFDWKFDKAPLRTVGSAAWVPSQNEVVAISGDGSGDRHLIALKVEKAAGATVAWESKKFKHTPYVPSVLSVGENIFLINDDGFASCVAAKDGKQLWREKLGDNVTASPVIIDGKIYAIGNKGKVFVLDATTSYKLIGESDLGESVSASPAVADGRLYVRTRSSLICIGKK